jgi:hypothetical protein
LCACLFLLLCGIANHCCCLERLDVERLFVYCLFVSFFV